MDQPYINELLDMLESGEYDEITQQNIIESIQQTFIIIEEAKKRLAELGVPFLQENGQTQKWRDRLTKFEKN